MGLPGFPSQLASECTRALDRGAEGARPARELTVRRDDGERRGVVVAFDLLDDAVVGAEVLDVPEHFSEVSSSAARAGAHHLIAPECRT